MKNYRIKNYKGNLVESLKRFAKSHKGMRIVEAVEDEDELKVKAESGSKLNTQTILKLIDELVDGLNEASSYFEDPAPAYIADKNEDEDIMYFSKNEFELFAKGCVLIAQAIGDLPNIRNTYVEDIVKLTKSI